MEHLFIPIEGSKLAVMQVGDKVMFPNSTVIRTVVKMGEYCSEGFPEFALDDDFGVRFGFNRVLWMSARIWKHINKLNEVIENLKEAESCR